MTISSAFGGSVAAADVAAAPTVRLAHARTPARMRAREYGSRSVLVNTFAGWGRHTWTDLRDAWFMPESLPTLRDAWADRIPDRDLVPGSNAVLYAGWVAYNHSIGLAVPLLALAVVGVLTPILWIARHPARLLLALTITGALYGLVI